MFRFPTLTSLVTFVPTCPGSESLQSFWLDRFISFLEGKQMLNMNSADCSPPSRQVCAPGGGVGSVNEWLVETSLVGVEGWRPLVRSCEVTALDIKEALIWQTAAGAHEHVQFMTLFTSSYFVVSTVFSADVHWNSFTGSCWSVICCLWGFLSN